MPLGLSSKSKKVETDEETRSMKSSLFSGRSKNKQSAPGANPYAVPSSSQDPQAPRNSHANPYAAQSAVSDPYAKSHSSLSSQPPTSSFGSLSLNSGNGAPPAYGYPSTSGPNRYEKSPAVAAGGQRYQAQGGAEQGGGYGNTPYSSSAQTRHNGYGGLTRTGSQDTVSTDAGRNALFGEAKARSQQQPPHSSEISGLPPQQQDSSYSTDTGYRSDAMPGGYGYGEEAPKTAEQIEQDEVEATTHEIKQYKKDTVSSSANARRMAEQTEALARETLGRLNEQGERIYNTERNLDLASNQNVLAKQKAGELKTLNRSMFAVHVDNPFTAKKREQAMLNIASEKRRDERDMHGATRADQFQSQARHQEHQRQVRDAAPPPRTQRNFAERSKYQFDASDEDDDMEDQIEDNLDAIHRSAKTMHQLGKAMGTELDKQNEHITRVAKKTDKVDDEIARNRALLDRF